MRFSDIPGLKKEKQDLLHAVKYNHVAHAQLFFGKTGSANLSLALAFATYLNCENQGEEDACGQCPSCLKSAKYIHPDMHFVFPVSPLEKKEPISQSFLPEWREFLLANPYGTETEWSNHFGGENKQLNISKEESRQIVRNLSLKSFEGRYKIMIIWLAEYLHPSAANGILKILEEPPENTVFILITYDREKLLTTILSRTQIFHVSSFADAEIASFLQEKHGINEARASQIATLANGDLNAAIKLITNVEDDSNKLFRDWMRACFSKNYETLLSWTDNFSSMNKVAQKSLIQYGLSMLRESLIAQNNASSLKRIISAEEGEFVEKFGQALKNYQKIELLYNVLNTLIYHLERNINVKIAFLDTSLKINAIIRK